MSRPKLKAGFIQPDKIFIWKSYGDVSVYPIDTEEKYWKLAESIFEACKFLGYVGELTAINIMIEEVGGVGCHETFEYGTGWGKLK